MSIFILILIVACYACKRSEIIHAERKREQQTFETIEEEDDDDDVAAGDSVSAANYNYSYGSLISLVDEARQHHGRGNRDGLDMFLVRRLVLQVLAF